MMPLTSPFDDEAPRSDNRGTLPTNGTHGNGLGDNFESQFQKLKTQLHRELLAPFRRGQPADYNRRSRSDQFANRNSQIRIYG